MRENKGRRKCMIGCSKLWMKIMGPMDHNQVEIKLILTNLNNQLEQEKLS